MHDFRKQFFARRKGKSYSGTMVHMVNGHVMSVVVDDDPARRKSGGLLGVQVHVGPPL